MTEVISQRELRNDSGAVLRRVDAGERFIVTRNGSPVAELTPLRRSRFVRTDHLAEQMRNAPRIALAELRADLDALASPDIDPRG